MGYLPVISDPQVLELGYALYPHLSTYPLVVQHPDISLGLIETRAQRAVLSVQASIVERACSLVSLSSLSYQLKPGYASLSLHPLHQLRLGFTGDDTIIEDLPLVLSYATPYAALVQHFIFARLEVTLAQLGIKRLTVDGARLGDTVALLELCGYQKNYDHYQKHLKSTLEASFS